MSSSLPRLLTLVPLLMLAGCASNPTASVTLSDDAKCPVQLKRGQTLIVSLPSNPTTGYRWNVQEVSEAQLKSLGPEVFSSPEKDVIGGDGVSTWRFQAAEPGQGRLYFTYLRPWESDGEPAGLFDCRVEVE